jgi:hypothetical protein
MPPTSPHSPVPAMSSNQTMPPSRSSPYPDPRIRRFNPEVWYVNPSDFEGEIPRVLKTCVRDFKRKSYGKDLTSNPRAIRRLLTQLYNARTCLHKWPSICIELDALHEGVDYRCNFARACRVHGCDEWGFTDPNDATTTSILMNVVYAHY